MLGVANLDASVTDSDLYDHFSNVVGYRVIWAEVRKDRRTDQCLGDGHVCCNNHQQGLSTLSSISNIIHNFYCFLLFYLLLSVRLFLIKTDPLCVNKWNPFV